MIFYNTPKKQYIFLFCTSQEAPRQSNTFCFVLTINLLPVDQHTIFFLVICHYLQSHPHFWGVTIKEAKDTPVETTVTWVWSMVSHCQSFTEILDYYMNKGSFYPLMERGRLDTRTVILQKNNHSPKNLNK